MIGMDKNIKIGDLGVVAEVVDKNMLLETSQSWSELQSNVFIQNVGSFGYFAPEIISSKPNRHSDIWSLACIALFCITKQTPYKKEKEKNQDVK